MTALNSIDEIRALLDLAREYKLTSVSLGDFSATFAPQASTPDSAPASEQPPVAPQTHPLLPTEEQFLFMSSEGIPDEALTAQTPADPPSKE